MSVVIAAGSVIGSYEQVQATGITDILYYTYWDLISTIYAQCGYSTTVDQEVLNNHGVTGKQVWDNFCTAVEGTAKFHGKLFKGCFDELKGLASNATAKGISMSQDLYDMLKDALATHAEECSTAYTGVISSVDSAKSIIAGICGTSVKAVPSYGLSGDCYLYMYRDSSGCINIFTTSLDNYVVDFGKYSFTSNNGTDYGATYGTTYTSSGGYVADVRVGGRTGTWLVCQSRIFCDKTISAKRVFEGACPQEVPETIPWRKEKSIPDGWRVVPQEVPGTGGDQEPDKDPKENPDILPVVIPFHPLTPDTPDTEEPGQKPDSTENPDKDPDSTENPGKDPDSDPDKDKNPATLPGYNPDSGRYIDPSTGWEIDPSTGQLINPETGELVNPETPDIVDKAESVGDITKVFPFCIPWDMMALVESLKADKEAPKFEFKYHFDVINYDFEVSVDMSDYWKYIKIFRWGMTIFFIIGLFFLTVKFTTFVYKMGS